MSILRDGKKLFKIVSTEIIVCVVAAALIGLGLLFGLIPSSDIIGKIMLTLLTLFIAGLLLLNSISAVKVGNKLGLFAAFMLMLSAVLFFVLIWAGDALGDFMSFFSYFIVIVSMVSIMLDVIVGNYIRLGKRLLAVQIIFYLSLAYIETTLAFAILGNSALINLWQIFVTAIIVVITLYIVLKVKQKNVSDADISKKCNDDEYVTITRTEYENIKALAERNGAGANAETPMIPIIPTGADGTAGINGAAGVAGAAGVVGATETDKNTEDTDKKA